MQPSPENRGTEIIVEMHMKHGLVYLRPTSMVSVRATGQYEQSIPEAWEKMFSWLARHRLSTPVGRGYGLAHDHVVNVPAVKRRYDACIQLTPLHEARAMRELSVLTLPGGPYLRRRLIGDYQDVCGLIASGSGAIEVPTDLRIDQRRPIVTIYLDDPSSTAPGQLRADVCWPISTVSSRSQAA